MGQAAHFNRYAVEPVPFASWRFTSQSRRLSHVLDRRLISFICSSKSSERSKARVLMSRYFQSNSPFVAGDRLTVADFAVFIFAHSSKWCGVDISGDEYPHLKAWHDKLAQRPASQNALQIPVPTNSVMMRCLIPTRRSFTTRFAGTVVR